MKQFKSTLAVTAALALVLGACSPKDKGPDALKSTEIAALGLDRADAEVFGDYFTVEPRKVDEAQAQAALAVMGLSEQSDERWSWASRTGDSGNYVYTDLTAEGDDDSERLVIREARFYGVHQVAGEDGEMQPSFDRVDFDELSLKSEDMNLSVAGISLVDPSPEMAASMIEELNSDANLSPARMSGEIPFRAMRVDALRFDGTNDDATFEGGLESLIWGMDADTKRLDGTMGEMTFTLEAPEEDGFDMTMSFDGATLRDVDTAQMFSSMDPAPGMTALLQQMNVYTAPYESFVMGAGRIESQLFGVDFAGAEGQAERKGDVTTVVQTMSPLTITIDTDALRKRPGNAGTQADIIEKLKLERMVFRSASRSILDEGKDEIRLEDGLFVLEDGFRLNMEYAARGLKAMQARAKAQAMDPERARLEAAIKTAEATEDYEDDVQALFELSEYDAAKAMDLMGPVELTSLRMSLEDNSIVARGLTLASEMTGQSEAALKRSLAMAVVAAPMMGRNDLESELLGEGAGAVAAFVKEGGTLSLALSPPEPLPLSALIEDGGASLDPARLGFTARHDAAED